MYLQVMLPKCIFVDQNKFPIIAYLRNKTTMELVPLPINIDVSLVVPINIHGQDDDSKGFKLNFSVEWRVRWRTFLSLRRPL